MPPPAEALPRADGSDAGEVVLTQALRSMRRSALRCRRARLMLDAPDAELPCVDATRSACFTHGRELPDRTS
jgi:hypothetical protein